MPGSERDGRGPLKFGQPVEITTEPGQYRGVRNQRVRLGSDLWVTVHEDARLTLGSYSLRFRVDYLTSHRDGSSVSLSTEPITAAEPVEEPPAVSAGFRERVTWSSEGATITAPASREEPMDDPAPMLDHMGRAIRVGDRVRQMGYWHGGRRRDVGRVGRVVRSTRAGTAEVALDATRDLPADVRNLGSSVLRRIDAGEPVDAFADDPAEELSG